MNSDTYDCADNVDTNLPQWLKNRQKVGKKTITKSSKVLEHLKSGNTLTPIQALELYGTMRLSAIVFNLKHKGYQIENINPKGEYAIYKLVNKVAK